MKFADMPYQRPQLDEAARQLAQMAKDIENAPTDKALVEGYQACCALMDKLGTAACIASIRHTVDTSDSFYDAENDYFDSENPLVNEKFLSVYRAILASPKKEALAQAYGGILLEKMENSIKSSDERLIALQQAENALETQYEKLYASAKIPFLGEELTVAQLGPHKQSTQRHIRKEAYEAEGGFFDSIGQELDEIYQKMVENRTEQARTLGYESFTPLGDIRMERLGYTRQDIKACRDAVVQGIVPVVQRLKKQQAQRIGVSDFSFYDDILSFIDGNPTPKGTPEEILAAGQSMYRQLSSETAEFIDFMMDGGLFDVLAKKGKAPGGYCTYIAQHKSPFIFSNFNGTAADVDVLTHEAGHAFAAYRAAKRGLLPELRSPGLESCEIHSMSMEFLTSEYHGLFFGQDTHKYAISHAEDALFFLPYGCQVDEFQERVYDQPSLNPKERHQLWLELERKYRPWNNFAQLPFYSRGAGWQRQLHIYKAPFYYIDYVLAQAVALQFFVMHNNDAKSAWQSYLSLTEKAGTDSYIGLVHAAGLKTPFQAGAMAQVGQEVAQWLEKQNQLD